MVEPDGNECWGYTTYIQIKPIDYYTASDAFSDAEGNINKELPLAEWLVKFTGKEESTLVETIITYQSLTDLEKTIQMGVEQGLKATLEKLDDLLANLTKQ